MEKRVSVSCLVLTKLGWVDEEIILECYEIRHAQAPRWQTQVSLITGLISRALLLSPQILSEFVPEVTRCILASEDCRRVLTQNRPVIGRENDLVTPSCGLPKYVERGRSLKPSSRQVTQRGLIPGYLHENRGLGASMRHQIHKIEDQRDHRPRLLKGRIHPATNVRSLPIGKDLIVVNRHISSS